jgi:predicted nucleic acid-binding protein
MKSVNGEIALMKVLDASIVLKWFVEEEGSEKALQILDEHVRGAAPIVIPDLLLYEIGNALKFSGGFAEQEVGEVFAALWSLDLFIVAPQPEIILSAVSLSFMFGLSLYDAAYIALAKEMGVALVTADKKLFKKTADLKFVELMD